jgi:hypothetical protein
MRLTIVLALAATAALFVGSAKAEDPGYALYMQWDDTDLRLEACKDHAEEALRAAAFREDVTRTDNSVYARRRGGYTAGVRCVEPKKMVFFVISGPRGSVASKYLDEIVKGF